MLLEGAYKANYAIGVNNIQLHKAVEHVGGVAARGLALSRRLAARASAWEAVEVRCEGLLANATAELKRERVFHKEYRRAARAYARTGPTIEYYRGLISFKVTWVTCAVCCMAHLRSVQCGCYVHACRLHGHR
jgi:hypothetical protein